MALKEKNSGRNPEPSAKASCQNLPVSTKQCIETCKMLRYKNTLVAKKMLEEVMKFDRAVPFPKFARDVAHRPGIGSGRYPQKAAKELLYLIKSAEANAQSKGLDVNHLKITKILANRAPVPRTGGRFRHGTKRTHLEIELTEVRVEEAGKDSKKNEVKKSQAKKGDKTPAASSVVGHNPKGEKQ